MSTRAEILSLPIQENGRILKASDTGTYFVIEEGGSGAAAVALVTSNPAGKTGASVVENHVVITRAGYLAESPPEPRTKYDVLDGPFSSYGAMVAGEWTEDTSATNATGMTTGEMRRNHATPSTITAIYANSDTSGEVDLATLLTLVKKGDTIIRQDATNSANLQVFTVSGAPSDSSGNWTIPVVYVSGGGDGITGFADGAPLLLLHRSTGNRQLILDHVAPQTLTSGTSVAMDANNGVNADLSHNHNATINLSNLSDGMGGTIRGTMAGATRSLLIAHAGLSVIAMSGSLSAISVLDTADKWSVAYQRVGAELWLWITTKEI